jgi:hypothetical protein
VESLPMVRGREEMPKMDMPIQQDLEE